MSEIDRQCRDLCKAINLVKGMRTISSCCGHGKTPYRVWFVAEDLGCLPDLLYWFDGCHSGYYGWQVTISTDCAKSLARFLIEGPTGEQAYKESEYIASLIIKEQS